MNVPGGTEQATVEARRQEVGSVCASCQIVGLGPDCCVFNENFKDWFPEARGRWSKCGGCDITSSVCPANESCLDPDRLDDDGGRPLAPAEEVMTDLNTADSAVVH